jgi:predicted dehydrogenase
VSSIRIGVFGCGRIANSAHLPAIRDSEAFELYAVVDPMADRARAARNEFGAETFYTSPEKALADPAIEAVALCLPHHLHARLAVAACAQGKHVLVEKPMTLTVREADEMIAAAEGHGVTLMVGQSRRFHRAILECKRRFGAIGEPLQLVTNWLGHIDEAKTEWWRDEAQAGGLLIPLQGSHAVDFQLWMLDAIPVRVYAQTKRTNPAWDGEDDAVIQMTFPNGAIGTVLLSFNAAGFEYERYIIGTKGTIRTRGETTLEVNGEVVVDGDEPNGSFIREYSEFADAIRGEREPLASGRQVRGVVQVLEAARESARAGRAIDVGGETSA